MVNESTFSVGQTVGIEWGAQLLEVTIVALHGRHAVVSVPVRSVDGATLSESTVSIPLDAVRASDLVDA